MIGNPLKDTFLKYLCTSLSFADDGPGGGGEGEGGEGGEDQAKWYDNLSDEYKANENVTKYKTQDEFIKSSLEAKSLGGIVKPKEDATEEEISKYYTELGRPETADAYELAEVKDMPEGLVVDDNVVAGMKELAFKQNLTQDQFAGMHQGYMDQTKQQFEELKATLKKQDDDARTELRIEWGSDFDRKEGLVNRVIDTYGGNKEQVDYLKGNFGSDPMIQRLLGNFGDTMSENRLKGGSSGGFSKNIDAQINAIRHDKNHPYNDRRHAGHKQAVADMQELYNQAEQS